MNKIKNLFKASPIAIVVAGLVIAGVASAAIVSYISNATTGSVAVSSPVEIRMNPGQDGTWSTARYLLPLAATTGGSSMPFTTIARNNANNRVGGYYVTVIEAKDSGDKVTGKEFSSIMFDKNKGDGHSQNGEMLNRLCVVEGNGSLTSLPDYIAANRSDKKLALLFDVDGNSQQVSNSIYESTGMCSALTPYIGNETRSFFHLNPGEIERWTFTPTWNPVVVGNFQISAQYVNDLAKFAAETY